MNVETKRLEVDAAMADIERKMAGALDPNPPRLHDRPSFTNTAAPGERPRITAELPKQNLPAILAEMQAEIAAEIARMRSDMAKCLEGIETRLSRIDAFLGIEPNA